MGEEGWWVNVHVGGKGQDEGGACAANLIIPYLGSPVKPARDNIADMTPHLGYELAQERLQRPMQYASLGACHLRKPWLCVFLWGLSTTRRRFVLGWP